MLWDVDQCVQGVQYDAEIDSRSQPYISDESMELRGKKTCAHFGDEKLISSIHNAGAEIVGADKLVRRKYGGKDYPDVEQLKT